MREHFDAQASRLREYYDADASRRDGGSIQEWKRIERERFVGAVRIIGAAARPRVCWSLALVLGKSNTCVSDVLRQLVLCWVHRSYRGGGVN